MRGQDVKRALVRSLHTGRGAACLAVLERSYASSDVIFLQVAAWPRRAWAVRTFYREFREFTWPSTLFWRC
jgi:hypothetical protein